MPSPSEQPLKPNPFNTYRDPQTGRWMVDTGTNAILNPTESTTQPWNTEWNTEAIAS